MAGTVNEQPLRHGATANAYRGVQGAPMDFEADSVDASFPEFSPSPMAGALPDVGIVFDAISPPDTLSVQILDKDGIDLLGGSGAIVTSSRRLPVSPPAVFTPGIKVVLGGNTLVSAKVKIILYII